MIRPPGLDHTVQSHVNGSLKQNFLQSVKYFY